VRLRLRIVGGQRRDSLARVLHRGRRRVLSCNM
jgi:hypothetical protein